MGKQVKVGTRMVQGYGEMAAWFFPIHMPPSSLMAWRKPGEWQRPPQAAQGGSGGKAERCFPRNH